MNTIIREITIKIAELFLCTSSSFFPPKVSSGVNKNGDAKASS